MAAESNLLKQQKLAWHHFCFTLPPLWEITGYMLPEDKGRIELSTRDGLQGWIGWRKCKAAPDISRIMNEVHRLYLKQNFPEKMQEFKKLSFDKIGSFTTGFTEAGGSCYADLFLEEKGILLEWVFPNYTESLFKKVIKPLLKTFRHNNNPDWHHWAAFGLDFKLPCQYFPVSIQPLPANVCINFENKKHHKITVHRWGIPEYLLGNGDLKSFYRKYLKLLHVSIVEHEETEFGEWPGARTVYRQRGKKGFNFLLGPWWLGHGAVWIKKEEKRIYAIEQVAPKRKMQPLELEDVFSS